MKNLLLLIIAFFSIGHLFAQEPDYYERQKEENERTAKMNEARLHDNHIPDTIKYGMSRKEVENILADGYTLPSGWTIYDGDTLEIGKGSLPNHRYTYIYESPINYFSRTSISTENKKYLNTNEAKFAIVKRIYFYGTKKGGFTVIANVGVGSLSRYWIEIDNAVESGEIKTPLKYQTKNSQSNESSNNTSTADELKKWKGLLDSEAITQEEYDAKKKQLLNL